VIGIQSDASSTSWWINDLTRRHEIKSTSMDGEATRLNERYGRGDNFVGRHRADAAPRGMAGIYSQQ
jgi:hypothetical protein